MPEQVISLLFSSEMPPKWTPWMLLSLLKTLAYILPKFCTSFIFQNHRL